MGRVKIEYDHRISAKRTCKTCRKFKSPGYRKHKRCEDLILTCRQSWNNGCCLWWERR